MNLYSGVYSLREVVSFLFKEEEFFLVAETSDAGVVGADNTAFEYDKEKLPEGYSLIRVPYFNTYSDSGLMVIPKGTLVVLAKLSQPLGYFNDYLASLLKLPPSEIPSYVSATAVEYEDVCVYVALIEPSFDTTDQLAQKAIGQAYAEYELGDKKAQLRITLKSLTNVMSRILKLKAATTTVVVSSGKISPEKGPDYNRYTFFNIKEGRVISKTIGIPPVGEYVYTFDKNLSSVDLEEYDVLVQKTNNNLVCAYRMEKRK